MDKVRSTGIDEAVAHTLDDLAATLRIPKQRIVEDAIRIDSETLDHQADPIDASFGAWRRSEPPDELHRRMRPAFEEAMHRHGR